MHKYVYFALFNSEVSSVQGGICALGKAHMRSTPSLRGFPSVAFETVPMFVWLTMTLSRPVKEDGLALPLSTPPSSRRSMVWRAWLCARRLRLKFLNTSDIFRDESYCDGCFCPPVSLLGHFPWFRHVYCSTAAGVFEGGCPTLTHASLGFQPHSSSFFVASSLTLWVWWHVWSDRQSSGEYVWLLLPPLSIFECANTHEKIRCSTTDTAKRVSLSSDRERQVTGFDWMEHSDTRRLDRS